MQRRMAQGRPGKECWREQFSKVSGCLQAIFKKEMGVQLIQLRKPLTDSLWAQDIHGILFSLLPGHAGRPVFTRPDMRPAYHLTGCVFFAPFLGWNKLSIANGKAPKVQKLSVKE